ncbi:VOC family protein [Halorussus sp. AFM4]|uniref:VOC family protein n=1 Tax=Halorussus sp. AFM4 TaxID=3421651 RepID=UPI003EBF5BE9
MAPTLGRMTLLVDDYEEALEYYTETMGFEVIADRELDDGFRALHVGSPDQESVGLWLVEAEGDAERELVGNQTGDYPSFVFYTDDVYRTYEELGDRGVEFTGEPQAGESGTHVHFEDLYGNCGVFVELDE